MSKLLFSVKPALMPSLVPHFLKWLWRYAVGGAVAYGLLRALEWIGVIAIHLGALLVSTVIVVVLLAVLSVKHRALRLHRTTYLFYDTHVVREQSLISLRRHSLPYSQISKVTNNSSLWNRIVGASDIILHTSRHDETQDLILQSVRDSNDIEHRIYALLKQRLSSAREDQ